MKLTMSGRESPSNKLNAVATVAFDVFDVGPFQNNRNDISALNDLGEFAGVCLNETSGRIEAFRQKDGQRIMLGTLGGSFSIARGINDRGEVVGGSLTEGDENFHAFVCRGDKLYDLNRFLDESAGWEIIQAVAINERGEILGIGSHEGEDRIVILRPRAR